MTERPAHSPLGASGAERWMNCPGSVRLLKALRITDTSDEPTYRRDGTAAHAALEHALREGLDAWELLGQVFGDKVTVNVEMADAIQVFLDTVRPSMIHALPDGVSIERGVDNPDFHPLFYGTVDCGVAYIQEGELWLDVNDFKYGEGVIVEVWENPQVMYYAYGLLMTFAPEIRPTKVRLRIIQPRGYHPEGSVREWIVDAQVIIDWAEGTLRPAMIRTETDAELNPGSWCRFCPAKLVCPVMVAMFKAASTANPANIPNLDDEAIDANYPLVSAVKSYLRALDEEAFRRLNLSGDFHNIKLVHKKANRVWKPGARERFAAVFGDKAFTPPELKSPAEMNKLGGLATGLVSEYGYTPESGLTVALATDKRPAVLVRHAAETFAAYIDGDDT